MAEFDIKKIITAVEQKVRQEDETSSANGRIDTEAEKSIFQQELNALVGQEGFTQDDANKIFGLYTQSAEPKKRQTGFALDTLKARSFDEIKDEAALTKVLSETFEKNKATKDGAVYTLLEDAINDVAAKFRAKEFNSKDDIKAINKELKAEIKKDETDPLKDFKLDVLEILIDKAEAAQKQKEFNEVKAKFNELRYPDTEKNKDAKPMSRKEAKKALFKEFKGKGSYYKEFFEKYVDGVIDKEILIPDAKAQIEESIKNQRGKSNITSWGDVKDAVRAELGEDDDAWVNLILAWGRDESRSFKEQYVNLDPSMTKAMGKSVASGNRIDNAVKNGFTIEDLEDVFGTHFWRGNWKNNHEAIEKLISAGLISEREDGKYDIKPLSDKIGLKAGGNNAVDYQKKELIPYSEMQNIITDILSEGNITATKLRKADVISLAKACGYDYNEDGFFKKLYQNTVGGVLGVAAGMLPTTVAGLNKDSIDVPYHIEITKDLQIEITLSTDGNASVNWGETIYDLLNQDVMSGVHLTEDDIELDGNTLRINKPLNEIIDGVSVEDLAEYGVGVDKTTAFIMSLGIALGMMALKAALQESKGELPVAVTQFDNKNMTYEKYLKELDVKVQNKQMTPQIASALKALAQAFVQIDDEGEQKLNDDGTVQWNKEGFKQLLNKMAGDQSFLNKYELHIGASNALDNEAKLVAEAQVINPCDEVDDTQETETGTETEKDTETRGKLRKITVKYETHKEDGRHTGWKELAGAYDDCFDKYFESNKVPVLKYKGKFVKNKNLAKTRILKLMQGIKDGNFSAARINELLDLVYKMEHKQPYEVPAYFDLAAYNSALNGAPGKETAMPDHMLYDDNVPEYELSEEQKAEYCKRGTFENKAYTKTGSISAAKGTNTIKDETTYIVDEKGDGNYKPITKEQYEEKLKTGKYDIDN